MVPGFRLLHGAAHQHYPYRIDKQFHGYHGLQFMRRGAVALAYGGEKPRILQGSWCWATYPGPQIRFEPAPGCPGWEHRYVAFTGPVVETWRAQRLWPIVPQEVPDAPWVSATLDRLIQLVNRDDHLGRLRACNLLEGLLLELADLRPSHHDQPAWLRSVLQALAPTAMAAPSVEQLAHQLGLHPRTLRRRFQAATGQGLAAYAIAARISEACRLLRESNLEIGAIARRLGYRDQYFFSRQFRQRCGVTPSDWRKGKN